MAANEECPPPNQFNMQDLAPTWNLLFSIGRNTFAFDRKDYFYLSIIWLSSRRPGISIEISRYPWCRPRLQNNKHKESWRVSTEIGATYYNIVPSKQNNHRRSTVKWVIKIKAVINLNYRGRWFTFSCIMVLVIIWLIKTTEGISHLRKATLPGSYSICLRYPAQGQLLMIFIRKAIPQ